MSEGIAGNPGDASAGSMRAAFHEMAAAAVKSAAAAERSAHLAEESAHAWRSTVKMQRATARRLRMMREETKAARSLTVIEISSAIKAGFSESDRGWKRTVIILGLGVMLSNLLGPAVSTALATLVRFMPK